MKSMMTFFAAALALPFFALADATLMDTVYVDSSFADYSGHDGSSPSLALKTIQEGVDAAAEGATVNVAAGTYSNGTTAATASYAACRVYVPRSMTIKGAGRDVTHLVGDLAANAAKTGTAAVAGFVIASTAAVTRIEGFTIRDCADSKKSDSGNGQGTAVRFLGGKSEMSLAERPWVVDCAVSNIYASVGAMSYVNVARTIFMNCVGHDFASVGDYCDFVYCIVAHQDQRHLYSKKNTNAHTFRGQHAYTNKNGKIIGNHIVNCTVVDCSSSVLLMSGSAPYAVHNSIVDYSGGIYPASLDCSVVNVKRTGLNGTSSTSRTNPASTNETATSVFDCGDKVIASVVTDDFRPVASNDLANGNSKTTYQSKALWLADTNNLSYFPDEFRWKDVYGTPVVANAEGKIHAGAVQTTMTPVSAFAVGTSDNNNACYLRVDGRALLLNVIRTTFTDVWPKMYRLEAISPSELADYGVTLPFFGFRMLNEQGSDSRYVFPDSQNRLPFVPPPNRLMTVEPLIATHTLYVDRAKENGEEVTGSGTAADPYARLQNAVSRVTADKGYRVYVNVAEGTYDQGAADVGLPHPKARLHFCTSGTVFRFVGTAGAEKTIITGAADPDGVHGCLSTNAMRCVYVNDGHNICLQGFTLTGGHTAGLGDTCVKEGKVQPIESANSWGRGAALMNITKTTAWLVECIVSNNVAYYGGGAICNCNAVKCRFMDNDVVKNGALFDTQNKGTYMLSSCLVEQKTRMTSGLVFGEEANECGFVLHSTVRANPQTHVKSTWKSFAFLINSIVWSSAYGAVTNGYRRTQGDYFHEFDYRGGGGNAPNVNYYFVDPQFVGTESGDYHLLPNSRAYGGGDAWTKMQPGTSWESTQAYRAYYRLLACDLDGNWPTFVNGDPTAGCYQIPDFTKMRVTTALPTHGGVTLDASSPTSQLVAADAPLTIAVNNGKRQVTGFVVNGDYRAATVTATGGSVTFTPAEVGVGTCAVSVVANTNWYVDASAAGSDANRGWSEADAFHTLTGVLAVAEAGDTVIALPGVYDEGALPHTNSIYRQLFKKTNDTIRLPSRAIVPANVTLVSRDGAEATVIKGAFGSDEFGCGEGAVRCLVVNRGSIVRGFTLTGGGTFKGPTDYQYEFFDNVSGGGLISLDPPYARECGVQPLVNGYVENCIISNNASHGSAAVLYANLVHCLIVKNRTLALRENNFVYDCVIGDNDVRDGVQGCYQPYYVDSCTFLGTDHKHDGTIVRSMYSYPGSAYWITRNSLFLGTVNNPLKYLFNCRGKFSRNNALNCWEDVATVTNATVDANHRPALDSNAVDAWRDGRTASSNLFHYVTPPALVRATDFAGGQRVYNGRRDIGAGEADWRAHYAATLGLRTRASVTEATTNVVETTEGVTLADAQRLAATVCNNQDRPVDCEWQVTVPAGGTLTARVNGVETTLSSGTFRHATQPGENTITFAYTGDGAALLKHFRRDLGTAIFLR